jgi:hypothetical protein
VSAKRAFEAITLMVQGTGVNREAARRGAHLTLHVLPTLSPRSQIALLELASALRRSEKALVSGGQSVAKLEQDHRPQSRVVEPDPRD